MALLLSGGIGDFLHYICRMPSFLEQRRLAAGDVLVCVESTVPHRVEAIFRRAFPELPFCFTPGAIHWTRANPLLLAHSKRERVHRPAYQYLREMGFDYIEDWFLPFYCMEYATDRAPLERIIGDRKPIDGSFVVVSARDKGFFWWPSEAASAILDDCLPAGVQPVYMGTPDEKHPWMSSLLTPPDLSDALAASYAAELFVGTDTGLATIRELTGRKNVYCISKFWLKKMMVRYRYLDASQLDQTPSVFANNLAELRQAVSEHFRAG